MKKLYALISATLVACGSLPAQGADVISYTPAGEASAFIPSLPSPAAAIARAPEAEKPSGQWENVGKGQWYEDMLTFYSDFSRGLSWEVDIEQSVSQPGWYRILPYSDPENPACKIMGTTDTKEYFYICTTNPNKVYFEDFKPFNGSFWFSHRVDEGGWGEHGDKYYGTLANGIISFPAEAVNLRDKRGSADYGWGQCNANGEFRIAMPGARPKDFSLKMEAPYCAEGDLVVDLAIGDDISSLKAILLKGEYSASGNESNILAAGKDVDPNLTSVALTSPAEGLHSFLMVGLDDADEVVARTEVYIFFTSDNAEKWQNYGTATLSEGLLSSYFTNIPAEDVTVGLQRDSENHDHYRLVDPYASHSLLQQLTFTHAGHHHYMYVNTDGAGGWYIEASPLGIEEATHGHAAVWSWAERYALAGLWQEASKNGLFGTRTGDEISMPDNTLLLGFSKYNGSAFFSAGKDFKITLHPDETGTGLAEISDTAVPAEYYNLQGVRVDRPAPGEIYIVRKGSATCKVLAK